MAQPSSSESDRESFVEAKINPAPNFQGYLLVKTHDHLNRWKTRYLALSGSVLFRLPCCDSTTPTQTLQILGADVKSNERKLEIKIKTDTRKLEVRARDRQSFQGWVQALNSASSWSDPTHTGQPLINSRNCDSMEELDDSCSESDDELCEFRTEQEEREFAEMLAIKRQLVFGKMKELKEMFRHLSPDGGLSDEEFRSSFFRASREYVSMSSSYISLVEAERGIWKKRFAEAQKDQDELNESLKYLAGQHRRLERRTSLAFQGEVPQGLQKYVEESDKGLESSEEEEEFFDAPELEEGLISRESSRQVGEVTPEPDLHFHQPPCGGFERRKALPAYGPEKRPGIWSVLKNNIGKDLSKVSMPISFNEPLSGLQKWCEELEYAHLLDQAARSPSSLERMAFVAAFFCSHYSATMHRLYKPFNPVLGETFECVRDEIGEGFKFHAEQVSHHPPISACHATGKAGWDYATTLQVKTAFKGKDMEIYPQGYSQIRFTNGEQITYKRITTCVRNIVVGKMWVDNFGTAELTNHQTGDRCILNFKPYSLFKGQVGVVEGQVFDVSGNQHYTLSGKWFEELFLRGNNQAEPLSIWKANPKPAHSSRFFFFTRFALTLNELDPGLEAVLPPSDSRHRPDIRIYEQGRLEEAQQEKERVEEKQRGAKRWRDARKEAWSPFFFERRLDPDLREEVWTSNDRYWESREKRTWPTLDLF